MHTRSLAACLALAVVPSLLLASCTATSVYPPVPGQTVSTPSVSPGPEVMAGAIREAHRLTAPNTPLIYNLPAGLPENTWNRVAFLLPDSARSMEPGDDAVYSVQQLRISGGTAEIDVVYPDRGVFQLMTVKLAGGPLTPWSVAWSYRWMIPAEKPTVNDPLQKAEMAAIESAKVESANSAANETAPASTDDGIK